MMDLVSRHKLYWAKTVRLTMGLLVLWFLAAVVIVFFARELSMYTLFGWSFSFYMAAQGSLVVFVAIAWIYARRMDALDREYGMQDSAPVAFRGHEHATVMPEMTLTPRDDDDGR